MAKDTPLQVTSLESIKEQLADKVVQLPGFTPEGEPFNARLHRLSLLELAESGSIPNELIGAVSQLYAKGAAGIEGIQQTAKAFHFIAGKSLVEPSYQQLKEAGLSLTDGQLLSIYLYSVGGVESLKSFR